LTGKEFFPQLISAPFHHALIIVFSVAILLSLIGAVASLFRGARYIHAEPDANTVPGAAGDTVAPRGGPTTGRRHIPRLADTG
jgi:hypothetical protein